MNINEKSFGQARAAAENDAINQFIGKRLLEIVREKNERTDKKDGSAMSP